MNRKVVIPFFAFILMVPLFSALAQGFGASSAGGRAKMGQLFQKSMLNSRESANTEAAEQQMGQQASSMAGQERGGIGLNYQIHLLGQVETPGTYRVSPSTRLDEAIGKARGISERGSHRRVELRRDGKVFRYDLFLFQRLGDLSQNPFLLENDVIFVPYAENNVAIHGPVKTNGLYELTENDKSVWGLIQLTGGFTAGISEKEPITIVRFIDEKKQLIKVQNVQSELERFELLNGDIVIIPHLLVKDRRFDYDVLELPADNMYYPTQKNEVFVTGAVGGPGAYPFNPTYLIRDYVNTAGPSEIANLRQTYVLTSNGKYVKNPQEKGNFHLSPGDTIVVPKRRLSTEGVLRWYNTALSTALSVFAWQHVFK